MAAISASACCAVAMRRLARPILQELRARPDVRSAQIYLRNIKPGARVYRAFFELAAGADKAAVLKVAMRLERREALVSMLKLAAAIKPIADDGTGWDTCGWLLGVPNGVVNLRDGRLRDMTLTLGAPSAPVPAKEDGQ